MEVIQSITRLWDRMIGVEGRAWTKRMGDTRGEQFLTFCEFSRDLTPCQIRKGFGQWMQSDDEFLTAKKFRRLCTKREPHDTNWQAYKILPRAVRIEDKGKREMSEKARKKAINDIRSKL